MLPTAPVQPAPTAGGAPGPPVFPPFGRAIPRVASGLVTTHGTGPSRPEVGCPLGLHPTEETCCVQHRVSVGGPVGQGSHHRDVVHAVRRDLALLVTIEPVEGEPTSRHVVHSP